MAGQPLLRTRPPSLARTYRGAVREDGADSEAESGVDSGAGTSSGPGPARVTLVGRPGCHLCDEARAVVREVAAQTGTTWTEVSLLDDPDLMARYAELVPVVLVDGAQHTFHRVDRARLREAVLAVPDGGPAWLRRWRRRPGV